MTMTIELETACYPIMVEEGIGQRLAEWVKAFGASRIAVVTDSNVWMHHGRAFAEQLPEADVTILPHGEATKSHDSLLMLYRRWIAMGLTRKDLVLAFGGGVIGDLTGYAAATYLRGVPFVQIPTTLLSQVDSSIGGKVAVDLPEGKNLVGTFYHPKAVWIDPHYLSTLPERFVRDGMAEVVKAGCIGDAELYAMLQSGGLPADPAQRIAMICRALSVKKALVEADEKEMGVRKLLNYGHTVGHALEAYGGYDRWTHGEAVAMGMVWISACSEQAGLTREGFTAELKELLESVGLPTDSAVPLEALEPWLSRDKKRTGKGIELALVSSPGQSFLHEVRQDKLLDFLKR